MSDITVRNRYFMRIEISSDCECVIVMNGVDNGKFWKSKTLPLIPSDRKVLLCHFHSSDYFSSAPRELKTRKIVKDRLNQHINIGSCGTMNHYIGYMGYDGE